MIFKTYKANIDYVFTYVYLYVCVRVYLNLSATKSVSILKFEIFIFTYEYIYKSELNFMFPCFRNHIIHTHASLDSTGPKSLNMFALVLKFLLLRFQAMLCVSNRKFAEKMLA